MLQSLSLKSIVGKVRLGHTFRQRVKYLPCIITFLDLNFPDDVTTYKICILLIVQ